MTQSRHFFPAALRIVALAAAIASTPMARADEYGDVNQLMRQGKQAEALTKADQYLAQRPKDPQMRFLRGVIVTEQGKAAEAIVTFTKLTEDYPELPEPYNNLAVLHAGQGQFDKARAALEMAIRTNPSYATAHENLGDVYAKLASQAYSRALQLDGNSAVQPKLALIRELFAPLGRGTPRPAAATVPSTQVAAAPAAAAARPAAPAPATPPAAATPAPAPAPAPAAAAAAAPAAPAATFGTDKDVEKAVLAWATAWASKDMGAYLGAYGKEFNPPRAQSRKDWEDERRKRIVGKSQISVKLSDLIVSVNGARATAKFKQAYTADSLNVSSRKTLELQKVGDRWVIVRESTG